MKMVGLSWTQESTHYLECVLRRPEVALKVKDERKGCISLPALLPTLLPPKSDCARSNVTRVAERPFALVILQARVDRDTMQGHDPCGPCRDYESKRLAVRLCRSTRLDNLEAVGPLLPVGQLVGLVFCVLRQRKQARVVFGNEAFVLLLTIGSKTFVLAVVVVAVALLVRFLIEVVLFVCVGHARRLRHLVVSVKGWLNRVSADEMINAVVCSERTAAHRRRGALQPARPSRRQGRQCAPGSCAQGSAGRGQNRRLMR